jgi:hypothetical protein
LFSFSIPFVPSLYPLFISFFYFFFLFHYLCFPFSFLCVSFSSLVSTLIFFYTSFSFSFILPFFILSLFPYVCVSFVYNIFPFLFLPSFLQLQPLFHWLLTPNTWKWFGNREIISLQRVFHYKALRLSTQVSDDLWKPVYLFGRQSVRASNRLIFDSCTHWWSFAQVEAIPTRQAKCPEAASSSSQGSKAPSHVNQSTTWRLKIWKALSSVRYL